jgi:hypothetical protein
MTNGSISISVESSLNLTPTLSLVRRGSINGSIPILPQVIPALTMIVTGKAPKADSITLSLKIQNLK